VSKIAPMNLRQRIFSRETLIAALLALMLIAIIVLTAETSPQWIYQGF
jgi:flagellar biosynthesis protein FlhB